MRFKFEHNNSERLMEGGKKKFLFRSQERTSAKAK